MSHLGMGMGGIRGVVGGGGVFDPLDRAETPGISAEDAAALLDGLENDDDDDVDDDETHFVSLTAGGDKAMGSGSSRYSSHPSPTTSPPPVGGGGSGGSGGASRGGGSGGDESGESGSGLGYEGGLGGAGASEAFGEKSSLYIRNLPSDADDLLLYRSFSPHGAIFSVRVMRDEDSGACRGIGFVNFMKRSEALAAIGALNGRVAAGSGSDRVLQISLQSPRVSRSSTSGSTTEARISRAGQSNNPRSSQTGGGAL